MTHSRHRIVACGDHDRRSISDLRLSVAIRTDARIDIFFFPVIPIRPERRRFAKAAVRAFVFPGINGQIVFSEMVIRTSQIVSIALGAIANSLNFTGHLFAEKKPFGPFCFQRLVFGRFMKSSSALAATPLCPIRQFVRTRPKADRRRVVERKSDIPNRPKFHRRK